jgi:flagellar basal body P-ring formation protein FlgA
MNGRWWKIAGTLVPVLLLWCGGALALEGANVVVTVNRVIYPGQTVTADAVEETQLRRPLREGTIVIRDMEALVGRVAARTILPKRLIPPSSIREAYAVEAGESATVYYRQGALVIAMDVVALQSAGYGEPIRVRNAQSGRTITGMVMPDGTVSVEAR